MESTPLGPPSGVGASPLVALHGLWKAQGGTLLATTLSRMPRG